MREFGQIPIGGSKHEMALTQSPRPVLRRKCSCGGSSSHEGECQECKKKTLQRRAAGNPAETAIAPPIVHEVLRSPGQPLDAATRSFFEPRFGHDFSKVRIHAGPKASLSAESVGALAYTVGSDIVLAKRSYGPGTDAGKTLLAHELTHVIQQDRPGEAQTAGLRIGSPTDAAEREADRIGHAVLAGKNIQVESGAQGVLQRLGANPTCTKAESDKIHQAIFDARGWLNKVIPKLEASPLATEVVSSLRRNFGPTYGVAANASLIHDRLKVAKAALGTIPFGCDTAGATPLCVAQHCGWATPGSNAATICTNSPSTLDLSWPQAPACMLHESMHASMGFMDVDRYKGTPGYPGVGTEPLKNPDSYTFLVEDLS